VKVLHDKSAAGDATLEAAHWPDYMA